MLQNLIYLRPEIFLSIVAMALLMLGVFKKNDPEITRKLFVISIISFLVTILLLDFIAGRATGGKGILFAMMAFDSNFVFDNFAYYIKILISLVSIAICIIGMNSNFYAGSSQNVFEFPVLIILSVVGMFLMVSANDLMLFYVGLELQSLALYILVAINRDSEIATESGVKYFVLGGLASGIILFGTSLVYGFSGSTNLEEIYVFSTLEDVTPLGIIFGFVLIISGLFFKLSAVPMHMWAPDIYEGATKTVVAFVATAPKIAALAFLIRFTTLINTDIFSSFSKIIVLVSILSMALGAFAALRQENFKRLLAYSSIANMGYMLIAVAIGSQAAIQSAVIYLIIYMVGAVGIFAILSTLQRNDKDLEKISSFSGLGKSNPLYALAMAILMFSIAGIPPMAGFFGKFFVFKEAVNEGFITLAIIGVLSSVVACYYYLRIIKVMYFDESSETSVISETGFTIQLTIIISVLFTLLMLLFTGKIIAIAEIASSSLL